MSVCVCVCVPVVLAELQVADEDLVVDHSAQVPWSEEVHTVQVRDVRPSVRATHNTVAKTMDYNKAF